MYLQCQLQLLVSVSILTLAALYDTIWLVMTSRNLKDYICVRAQRGLHLFLYHTKVCMTVIAYQYA